MEYTYISWYDITDLVVYIMISLWFTIIWLTAVECMYPKWPRMWSVCHNHNPVLSALIKYNRVCCKSNTKGATSDAGTLSSPQFWFFIVVFVLLNLFSVMFCPFVLFCFDHCLSFWEDNPFVSSKISHPSMRWWWCPPCTSPTYLVGFS